MAPDLTVVGAGAIGGTVGAFLAHGGEDIQFVDQDAEHVRAMRQHGLTIRGMDETFTVPVRAMTPDELRASGQTDLPTVLLAVKAPATERAVQGFADLLAPNGAVVSLQNGLNELTIARLVGEPRTVGAFVNFSADYLEPGLIHFAGRGAFVVGELDRSRSARVQRLKHTLRHFADVEVTDNIWGYLWGKQAYGAMLYATSVSNDGMADGIDHHRALVVALAREVLGVADALNVRPLGFDGFEPDAIASNDPAVVNASLDRLVARRRVDQKIHTGIWRDLAVRKRRTEVDAHFGPVLAEGERVGRPTPLLARLVSMIHELEDGRPLQSSNYDELGSGLAVTV
jgi:2-dehydropantoate 2-reductase